MIETRPRGKVYDISRWLVWDAYQKVKANKGAAGVDQQSLADFAQDESNNLYKIWNRMSSGSYFPPPVRAVEIPKKDGGVRLLGVPTVADRVAQTVVAMVLEPLVEKVFHPDSYGYRPGRFAVVCSAVAKRSDPTTGRHIGCPGSWYPARVRYFPFVVESVHALCL